VNRRDLIALLGSTAATWPLGVSAQQTERVRRIGVLMPFAIGSPQYQERVGAFLERFTELGWTDGRNVKIEYRAITGSPDEIRKYATELVALAPNAILATGVSTVGPLQQVTSVVPIVFAVVPDPVGAGIVDSLARPGGNVTGFTTFEYGLSGKWLELLKEVAPRVTRAAILRNAAISAGIGQFAAIQSVAPLLGVELTPMNVRDASEIERSVTEFSRAPNAGLIVTGSALVAAHRELLITGALAAGEQAIVADAVKACGQHVHEKAADELVDGERHHLVAFAPFESVVLPFEGDAFPVACDQAAI
jgi:putative ABC transport system substrate-binding protein